MTILVLIVLFGVLATVLLDGDWRTGLIVALLIGFVQDPLRKITPDQPGWMVGLSLIAFTLCALVLVERMQGRFNLRAMFWTVPRFDEWVSIYFTLIAFQSLNSLARFSDPRLTFIGAAFYLAPAFGMWVGFQVGCDLPLLKRLLTLYLIFSVVVGITVYLSFIGIDHPALKEVGEGLLITFEGFSAPGACGLWRTSEIASWHLSAAACIAASFGLASQKPTNQFGLLLLAVGFAFLTILTGRRKAQVLILAFVAIYLLLFSRRASPASKERVITSVLGVAAIAYPLYAFFLSENLGENFGEFTNRSLSVQDDLAERVEKQGFRAMFRAIQVSDGIGMGVGAGASTGGLIQNAARSAIRSVAFVSEGGGGRLILELGIPGIIILVVILVLLGLVLVRNFRLLKQMPQSTATLLIGLVAFAVANVPAFFSAAQLYGDPFVLILISICLGPFLAIPTLLAQQQEQWIQWQRQQERVAISGGSRPLP